jgi:hypothetical protein
MNHGMKSLKKKIDVLSAEVAELEAIFGRRERVTAAIEASGAVAVAMSHAEREMRITRAMTAADKEQTAAARALRTAEQKLEWRRKQLAIAEAEETEARQHLAAVTARTNDLCRRERAAAQGEHARVVEVAQRHTRDAKTSLASAGYARYRRKRAELDKLQRRLAAKHAQKSRYSDLPDGAPRPVVPLPVP